MNRSDQPLTRSLRVTTLGVLSLTAAAMATLLMYQPMTDYGDLNAAFVRWRGYVISDFVLIVVGFSLIVVGLVVKRLDRFTGSGTAPAAASLVRLLGFLTLVVALFALITVFVEMSKWASDNHGDVYGRFAVHLVLVILLSVIGALQLAVGSALRRAGITV